MPVIDPIPQFNINTFNQLVFNGGKTDLSSNLVGPTKQDSTTYMVVPVEINFTIIDSHATKATVLRDNLGCMVFTLLPNQQASQCWGNKAARKDRWLLLEGAEGTYKGKKGRSTVRRAFFENPSSKYVCLGDHPHQGTARGIVEENDNTKKSFARLVNTIETLIASWLPTTELRNRALADQVIGVGKHGLGSSKNNGHMFASLAMGKRIFLNCHQDEDAWYSAIVVFADPNCKDHQASNILAYMCFPEDGYALALRDGDCLCFHPMKPHAISSGAVQYDYRCLSFYVKSKLVGGNDNSKPLTKEQNKMLHNSIADGNV